MSYNKPPNLFWNNFSGWNNFDIISDVATCEIHEWALTELWNYFNNFSDIEHVGRYSWAGISHWNFFETILGAEIISK